MWNVSLCRNSRISTSSARWLTPFLPSVPLPTPRCLPHQSGGCYLFRILLRIVDRIPWTSRPFLGWKGFPRSSLSKPSSEAIVPNCHWIPCTRSLLVHISLYLWLFQSVITQNSLNKLHFNFDFAWILRSFRSFSDQRSVASNPFDTRFPIHYFFIHCLSHSSPSLRRVLIFPFS